MKIKRISQGDFFPLVQASLAAGVSLQFRARGFSMQPHIFDGDVLLVQALGDQALCVNEIVLARSHEGESCVHRIAQIRKNQVLLRADASPLESWFDKSAVLGRVRLLRLKNHIKRAQFLLVRVLRTIFNVARQKSPSADR